MKRRGIRSVESAQKRLLFWTAALLMMGTALLLALCAVGGRAYMLPYYTEESEILTDGWMLGRQAEGDFEPVTLPDTVSGEQGGHIVLRRILPEYDDSAADTVLLRALHLNVSVYLEGKQIYSYGEDLMPFSNTPARTVHLIRLPPETGGKELVIVLEPKLAGTAEYQIHAPEMGTEISVISGLIKTDFLAVGGALILMFLGICLMIINIYLSRLDFGNQLFYLGMLALAGGVFSFCETELAVVLTGNPYLIHTGDAVGLILICLPVFALLRMRCREYCTAAVRLMFLYVVLNYLIQNLLNFVWGIDYRYFVLLSHLGVIICIIIVLATVVRTLRARDKKTFSYMLSFIPLVVGAMLELFDFYGSAYSGFFFETGIFLLIVMQIGDLGRNILESYQQAGRSELYRQQVAALENQYEVIRQSEEKVRMLRHDLRHYNRLVAEHVKMGQTEAAMAVLEDAEQILWESQVKRYCENITVNAILTSYLERAEADNIDVSVRLDIPARLPVQATELSVMLANGLENAMEACRKLPEGTKRRIWLKVRCMDERLAIELSNTCGEPPEFDRNGLPVSSKGEGHGIGTRSIAGFVQRYGGMLDYEYEDRRLNLRILIG